MYQKFKNTSRREYKWVGSWVLTWAAIDFHYSIGGRSRKISCGQWKQKLHTSHKHQGFEALVGGYGLWIHRPSGLLEPWGPWMESARFFLGFPQEWCCLLGLWFSWLLALPSPLYLEVVFTSPLPQDKEVLFFLIQESKAVRNPRRLGGPREGKFWWL